MNKKNAECLQGQPDHAPVKVMLAAVLGPEQQECI